MKVKGANTNPGPRLPSWLWHKPKPEPQFSPILARLCWAALGFAVAGILAAAITS